MRISFTASLFLALGLIHPINMSFSALPEDLEGSGYDLDSSGSGSGSGDWSHQGEIKDHTSSKDVRILAENARSGTKNSFHGSSVPTFDKTHWPAKYDESEFVIMEHSKSFFENKEIFAGVIAGGVTGVTIAAMLTAILIYKWQKKDNGGYILGQQRASDEDYHKPNRGEVVV